MNVFNHDGTTRPSSPRSDYSKKGNRQEYSIFGWADEPASLRDAKSETQRMLNAAQERTQASTPSKVAGVRTNGADWKIPHRPVSARRLHDIQGHNIFDDGAQAPRRQVSGRKLTDMQGSYSFAPSEGSSRGQSTPSAGSPRAKRIEDMHSTVFSAAADVLKSRHGAPKGQQAAETEDRPARKHVDASERSAADWVGGGKVVDSPKVTSRPNASRVPPGGRSQITFG